ncbi:hypothetical protein CLV28_2264 [Sediminihabitans luteus]|uniref:Uncharacterized protein n=1 Tax=Sediminihabitans luteus TaxID=1138585 RepID=A0A2M9CEW6_9CELL|nr:hypothetical protein CLV28_2264 [Sediminihabitans luteus]GII97901.1 hypothetical protein Slu03_02790 [Sediminihabitans luteus]
MVAVAALLLVATAACGTDASPPSSASPPPSSTSSTTSTSPSTAPEASQTSGAGATGADAGCAPGGDGTPAGAGAAPVVDVDGDGAPDTAWITPGADRRIGVTTASGATFSAPIRTASPVPASAVVNVVATAGGSAGMSSAPIVLVDVGRETLLFSLAACAVTPTVDDRGDQYRFDLGFAGHGTGVGCTEQDGALHLAGLLATSEGDGYAVTRTMIDLSADATHATNGASDTVATDAASSDPVVTTAQETSCGDLVAGTDGPVEPRS